jgi:protein required for attachment to host cells
MTDKTAKPLLREQLSGHWFVVTSQRSMKVFTADESHHFHLIFEKPNSFHHSTAKKVHFSDSKKHQSQEESAEHFCKEIAQYLKTEKVKKSFRDFTLAAEPKFLGKLKLAMDPQLQESVFRWVHKDLDKTLQKDLPQFLIPQISKEDFSVQ